MTRHLLEVDDLTPDELGQVLALGRRPEWAPALAGRGAALLFEKPSARTRSATEMAVVQLGGHPVYVRPDEVGIDTRETAEDLIRTLAAYHAVVCARVFEHTKLERMAAVDVVPVVNLLSDHGHPVQALADLLTLGDEFGPDLAGRTLAWVGDWSNVARSLGRAAAMTGMHLRIACPEGYGPSDEELGGLDLLGRGAIESGADPARAVSGADAVSTDAWYAMGEEDEAAVRRQVFGDFAVDERLMARAGSHAIFLHCLPAHRGEEVTDGVMDGPASRVWAQTVHRMHSMRGLLTWLLAR